jgi:hypothetical protein
MHGRVYRDGKPIAPVLPSFASGSLPSLVNDFNPYTFEDQGQLIYISDEGVPAYSNAAGSWIRLGSGTASITYVIDGGGTAITTGIKGDLEIPFACTINRVTLLADQVGSAVVNIWKDSYANYPPTVADKITASAPPTITAAIKSQDSTLTGWTTAIAAGDTLRFNVDSVATIQRLTLSLRVVR